MTRNPLRAGVVAIAAALLLAPAASAAERLHGKSLDAALQPYLARHGLPALAAAVAVKGRIVASGAVGTRRAGTNIPVAIDDRFHLGSNTKAMTSLLAAMLVEEGALGWGATVGERFPELGKAFAPDVAGITLEQLLSHTSGIPGDNAAQEKLLAESYEQDALNLDELRYWVAERLVALPLKSKPGERFEYANMGYLLASAMLERAAGRTWEEMIVERIFAPLGLRTAGLGPQARPGRVDAPLGHVAREGAPPKPMLAGPNGDVPAVLGPAGNAHMSILDFARWAAWNAGEGRRGPGLVRAETLKKLHTKAIDIPPRPDAAPGTPGLGSYGFGWGTVSEPFAPEPILYHGGSNTMNLAHVYVQPARDFAMVMATNVGGRRAEDAFKALAKDLYERFAPRGR
ncbi:MAG: beta-lactamase family protein [Alphaproteobacteria bacterium]|nr:beta-lactamase family protein [Alphaproteobacteria bacterium]